MHRTTVAIPAPILKRIQEACKMQDIRMSEFIRNAIEAALLKIGK